MSTCHVPWTSRVLIKGCEAVDGTSSGELEISTNPLPEIYKTSDEIQLGYMIIEMTSTDEFESSETNTMYDVPMSNPSYIETSMSSVADNGSSMELHTNLDPGEIKPSETEVLDDRLFTTDKVFSSNDERLEDIPNTTDENLSLQSSDYSTTLEFLKNMETVKDFQKLESFDTILTILRQLSTDVNTLRNDFIVLSTPVSNSEETSSPSQPDDPKPIPAPDVVPERNIPKSESEGGNGSVPDNNTKGRTVRPRPKPKPTTPTPRPGLPVDIPPGRRRNPPRLPIAHPRTTTPPMRTTTPTLPTRFVWNATITRFRDPDDQQAMLWGLVVTLSVAVFGLSIGITCYCYWKRGPRVRITADGRMQTTGGGARSKTRTVQKPMSQEEGFEEIPLDKRSDETEFGTDDIENLGATGGVGVPIEIPIEEEVTHFVKKRAAIGKTAGLIPTKKNI